MNNVFVVNAGSSSLKYQLIDMDTENVVVSGNCERIGIGGGRVIYKKDGEKKVYENIEKIAFYHNGSCCFRYAGILCTGCGK